VAQTMIHVKATMTEGNYPVIRVEDQVVEMDDLQRELRRFVKSTGKTSLLLEHDNNVTQDTVIQIIDRAKGAGMDNVRFVVQ